MLVVTNGEVKSARVGVRVLEKLVEISISESHLLEQTRTIGEELAQQRDAQAAQHALGQLKPEVKEAPSLAVVAVDGGRIQTRAEDGGRGVHEQGWKETKVACLMTMSSKASKVDPHPELPRCFADRPYVDRMVREMKSLRKEKETSSNAEQAPDALDASEAAEPSVLQEFVENVDPELEELFQRYEAQEKTAGRNRSAAWRPKRLVRTCVSGLCSSNEFGPMVAAEAQRRNFYAAPRQAFLGDGLPWNWTLHKRYFPDFVPILDFVHPLTYLYEASRVMAGSGDAWDLYVRWANDCWQGRAASVLEQLQQWQADHPSPPEKLPDNDARAIIAKTATYLEHNLQRMDYPEYRCQGLPVTSAMVESLIKEVNHRVKGSEKFWNRPSGAEAILQVRTALLCEDRDRLSEYILNRPGSAFHRPSTNKRHCQHSNATATAS